MRWTRGGDLQGVLEDIVKQCLCCRSLTVGSYGYMRWLLCDLGPSSSPENVVLPERNFYLSFGWPVFKSDRCGGWAGVALEIAEMGLWKG